MCPISKIVHTCEIVHTYEIVHTCRISCYSAEVTQSYSVYIKDYYHSPLFRSYNLEVSDCCFLVLISNGLELVADWNY